MIPFDVVVSFIAGLLLAYAARNQLRSETDLFYNKYLYIAILWMALIYGPSAMFFFYAWPDWNSIYLFGDSLPDWIIWIDGTLLVVAVIAGFVSAHILIKNGTDNRVLLTAVAAAVLLGIYFIITPERSFRVGTYAEWIAGTAPLLWETPVLISNVYAGIIDLGSMALIGYRFRTES